MPLVPPRSHGAALERSPSARRSTLVIEILSFVLIAFLVSSALLFNLTTPGKLASTDRSEPIQALPAAAGSGSSPVPAIDESSATSAGSAQQETVAVAPAVPESPPAESAAALPDVEPAAGSAASENPPLVPPGAPANDATENPPPNEAGAASVASLPARGPVESGAAMLPYGSTTEPTESHVAAPAPESPSETASLPLSPEAAEALLKRGDDFLRTGDIVAARLSYERAAAAGGGAAATGVAKTYDPLFLTQAGVRGLRGDPARAAIWYGRAAAAGDREAQQRLRALRLQFPQ